ncbi:helix-turn-helix domain-containing protein [Novosphingobium sp. PASSN1]|uniref:helix-turn-helix transcriptional regulator n=1 Tax=Novosphingobium sp. PASSN1 TaxID=2015561 RepID=UPI000BC62246|nr:helix-turn-helix domain-containing protein [Novosphingobium sp. PASSN1]OYU35686.1 MAG: transcriptional regulator [Novosphingobium sp. PASSN1]
MSDLTTKVPEFAPRFLRAPDAAIYVGLSPRTLEKHRTYGTGPSFHRLGGRVAYALEDLDRWAEQGMHRSTCDPGTDTGHPAKRITPGREAR